MRKLLLATTAVTFVASAGSAFAQETDSDSFLVTATAEEAINVECDPTLSFGTFAISSGNGTGDITVSTTDGTTSNPVSGVVMLSDGVAVDCTVTGVDGAAASAAIDGGTSVTLTETIGGVKELSATLALSNSTALTENEVIKIGGALTIPANFASTHDFGTYELAGVTLTVTDE